MADGERPVGQELYQKVDPELFEYGGVTVYSPTYGKSFLIEAEDRVDIKRCLDDPIYSHVMLFQGDVTYCLFMNDVEDFNGFIDSLSQLGFAVSDIMKSAANNSEQLTKLKGFQRQQLDLMGRPQLPEGIGILDSDQLEQLGMANELIEQVFKTETGELSPLEGFRQNSAMINELILSLINGGDSKDFPDVDRGVGHLVHVQSAVLRQIVEQSRNEGDDCVKVIGTILCEDKEIRRNALNYAVNTSLLPTDSSDSMQKPLAEIFNDYDSSFEDVVDGVKGLYEGVLRSDAEHFVKFINSRRKERTERELVAGMVTLQEQNAEMSARLATMAEKMDQLTALVEKLTGGNDEQK